MIEPADSVLETIPAPAPEGDDMTREVFLLQMSVYADSAAPDELAVVAKMAERIDAARGYYGALELAKDDRDFRLEAVAEAIDGLAYCCMQLLRKEQG